MISNIKSLTENFFKLQQLKYERNVSIGTPNKENINLSYIIEEFIDKEKELGGTIGVIVKDLTDECSYNVILEAEKIGTKIPKLLRMMVIANQFSPLARQLADNLGIITFTRSELESINLLYLQTKTAFNA